VIIGGGCVRLDLYARQQPMGRSLSVTPSLSAEVLFAYVVCGRVWGPVGGCLHFGPVVSMAEHDWWYQSRHHVLAQTHEHVGRAPGLAIAGFGGLKRQVRLSLLVQQLHCSCGS